MRELAAHLYCLVVTPQRDILARVTGGKDAILSRGYFWAIEKPLTSNECKLIPCQVNHVILASVSYLHEWYAVSAWARVPLVHYPNQVVTNVMLR
jgi:hypothetical protein